MRHDAASGYLQPVRKRVKRRHIRHMETARNYRLRDLFFEAVSVERRILVRIFTAISAFVVDGLGLLLGVGIRRLKN